MALYHAYYLSLLVIELEKLLVNDKITVSCQIIVSQALFQTSLHYKQKPRFAIHFNLLQVCSSVPPFVFILLFIPFSNVLKGYFYVSPNLEAVAAVRMLINFVMQLL